MNGYLACTVAVVLQRTLKPYQSYAFTSGVRTVALDPRDEILGDVRIMLLRHGVRMVADLSIIWM
jgi:hypothetical protein